MKVPFCTNTIGDFLRDHLVHMMTTSCGSLIFVCKESHLFRWNSYRVR